MTALQALTSHVLCALQALCFLDETNSGSEVFVG